MSHTQYTQYKRALLAQGASYINSIIILREINSQNFSWSFRIMRHGFIYSVLYLSTLTCFTAATPPRWNKAPQSKICLPFDLNISAAEEITPESISSSDEQIASSPATDNLINPSRYTLEELEANDLVFPGPRGPNPSAGVQPASSHSRDHRGYPLAQQSFSSRFSSTSLGKRKMRDSSVGSTSKRYKKVENFDRYEPYNVINQHFSPKNPASNVIPTSSKPGYILPTRDELGKCKVEESAVCSGIETNKREATLFNVYGWNFLREFPEIEKPNDQQHQYLRYLNKCKGSSDVESFFFIDRYQAKDFLTDFVSRKHYLEFKLPLDPKKRPERLFKTLLRVSDKKINLQGYTFFQQEIIESMRRRLLRNIDATEKKSGPKKETIIKFVQEVTKVTQLLIVVHLSLFKQHETEELTVQEVEKHLMFLQIMWFQIDQGSPEMQKKDWALKAHKLLKFQAHELPVHFLGVRRGLMYNFCWDVVNHWREKMGNSFTGFDDQQKVLNKLKDMIEKIIFFSNNQA